jgi:hypothetical protein
VAAILAVMREGLRVFVVESTGRAAGETFRQFWQRIQPTETVYATASEQRIVDNEMGGSIRFLSLGSEAARGHSADIIVAGLTTRDYPPEAFGDILPVLAGSPVGEFMRP